MIKRICDICKLEIETKKVHEIEIIEWELTEEGNHDAGETIICREICNKCKKEIIDLIKEKSV